MVAIIIASGPSVTPEDIAVAKNAKDLAAITVNTSFRVAPWADYHYSNDHDWFETYIDEIKATCSGVPVCGHEKWRHPAVCSDYQLDRTAFRLRTTPGVLAWGGNSGFAAINLAYHLGHRKILLLGYDMDWDGDKSHHHGHHPNHLQHRKPGFHRWLPYYDRAAKQAPSLGLEIINCSRKTALSCFRRMQIQDAINEL